MSGGWRDKLVCDDAGKPVKGLAVNIFLMLTNHPDVAGMFAVRDGVSMVVRQPPYEAKDPEWKPRSMDRLDILRVKMWLQDQGFMPSKSQISDAIRIILARQC